MSASENDESGERRRPDPVDVDVLLRQIVDLKTRRAAEDLAADWERQGFVDQQRIDRLAVTRELTPTQLAEVMAVLQQLAIPRDDEPDASELSADDLLKLEESATANAPATFANRKYTLRHEEVLQLSRAIRLAQQAIIDRSGAFDSERQQIIRRGELAREKLIISNLGLVHSLAPHYLIHPALPIEDLVQEGIIGLMKAVERFDGTKGYRFSTYAVWWIRQAIMRALANRGTTIRIPVHKINDVLKLKRTKDLLRREGNGEEPAVAALATALQWSLEKVAVTEELSRMSYLSLDAPLADESDHSIGDLLQADTLSPLEACEAKERQAWVTEAIEGLTRREREVVRRRFGLGTFGIPETLEEIGDDFRLTRERIRQIQQEALKCLRPRAQRWIDKGVTD